MLLQRASTEISGFLSGSYCVWAVKIHLKKKIYLFILKCTVAVCLCCFRNQVKWMCFWAINQKETHKWRNSLCKTNWTGRDHCVAKLTLAATKDKQWRKKNEDKFSEGTETMVLKEAWFFCARKHLEAFYRAENQVVNGCTGINIKVASNGNLLCHSTTVYCLIHLLVALRKVMGVKRIILSLRRMLNEASHVVLISRRKESKETPYKPCWKWFRCLRS